MYAQRCALARRLPSEYLSRFREDEIDRAINRPYNTLASPPNSIRQGKSIDAVFSTTEEEAGQGSTEYALILVLVAIGLVVLLTILGRGVGDAYQSISDSLPLGVGYGGNCTEPQMTLITNALDSADCWGESEHSARVSCASHAVSSVLPAVPSAQEHECAGSVINYWARGEEPPSPD